MWFQCSECTLAYNLSTLLLIIVQYHRILPTLWRLTNVIRPIIIISPFSPSLFARLTIDWLGIVKPATYDGDVYVKPLAGLTGISEY